MVAVDTMRVLDTGSLEACEPDATPGTVAPRPVAKISRNSSARAGFAEVTRLPSEACKIAPVSTPAWFTVKMAGAEGESEIVIGLLEVPFKLTTTSAELWPS